MKNIFSLFRINKLKKINKIVEKDICVSLIIIFMIVIVILLLIKVSKLYYNNKEGYNNNKEGYNNNNNNKSYTGSKGALHSDVTDITDTAAGVVENTTDYGMDKVSYLDDKVSSGLDSVVDFLSEKKEIPPQWRDFYGDGEMGETDVYKEPPDTSTIINDTCSTKGFLYSDYKDDICEKYGRNPRELDEKCKTLSVTNCKIPSCCVLLNGKQCRAGNIHGPLFLTDKGKDIDFSFYYNKQRCYGLCDTSFNPLEKCDKYLHNSVGISKECMVQMFNHFGCSNTEPDYFINDDMVKEYKLSSKNYIEKHIKTEVGGLANDRYNLDNIIKCKGKPYVIEKYREFNTLYTPDTPEKEIMDTLRTKNQIGLEQIFLNYYK